MPPKIERIEYIDALRGLTMILVVFSHVTLFCMADTYIGFNDVFIRFRMPVFFFISGWVLFKSERIWANDVITKFIKNKFLVQIVPILFFLPLFVYLFPEFPVGASFNDKYGYWFTLALFEYFILYIFAESLLNKRSTGRREYLVAVLFVTISLAAFYYEQVRFSPLMEDVRPVLSIFSFTKMKYAFFFWLGTFVKKNFNTFTDLTDNQYVIAAIIVAFVALSIFTPHVKVTVIEFLIEGTTGIVILFTFFRKHADIFSSNKLVGKWLQFIGRRTLDIYLLHYFFLPYGMKHTWLSLPEGCGKTLELLVALVPTLWVVIISLLVSSFIRLSPFLGHYLFGVKKY